MTRLYGIFSPMITNEKIEELKKKLEAERDELRAQIEKHSKPVNFGDEGRVEDPQSEEADEAEEFSNDLSVAQAFRERLEEVENALNLMHEGKYGKCQKCGKDISSELLEKQPTRMVGENCA